MGTQSPINKKKEFYYFRFSSILQSMIKADLRPTTHVMNRFINQKYLEDGGEAMDHIETYRSREDRSFSPRA